MKSRVGNAWESGKSTTITVRVCERTWECVSVFYKEARFSSLSCFSSKHFLILTHKQIQALYFCEIYTSRSIQAHISNTKPRLIPLHRSFIYLFKKVILLTLAAFIYVTYFFGICLPYSVLHWKDVLQAVLTLLKHDYASNMHHSITYIKLINFKIDYSSFNSSIFQ